MSGASTTSPANRSGLPIALEDLIHARSVEDNRREFKAAWNPVTQTAVVRTICAFANDLLNLNGGYVLLGIETDDRGNPILPPRGLGDSNIDLIQRELIGQCNRINPHYLPRLFPVSFADRNYSAGMADVRQGGTIGLPAKTLVNASMTLPPFLRMVEM